MLGSLLAGFALGGAEVSSPIGPEGAQTRTRQAALAAGLSLRSPGPDLQRDRYLASSALRSLCVGQKREHGDDQICAIRSLVAILSSSCCGQETSRVVCSWPLLFPVCLSIDTLLLRSEGRSPAGEGESLPRPRHGGGSCPEGGRGRG